MNNNNYIILERGKHFTLTALARHLNNIYGSKESGRFYDATDINKYIARGHLPLYLGGNVLTEIRDSDIGLKLVKIEDEIYKTFLKLKG